ncbi:MAG: hypothetical protein JNL48_06270, partial [Acidobacteria bacterium]|nr:hypothetical protein [Acidobacteriota bacterium]
MPLHGVKYLPYRDSEYFQNPSRVEYFEGVPTDWLAQAVVFFDPDVGLQTGSPFYMQRHGAEKYLMYADLCSVWARASEDSLFVVYQHLQNDATKRAGDLERRCHELMSHLATQSVWAVQWTDVALVVAVRNGPLALRVRLLLLEHAQRHAVLLSDARRQPRTRDASPPEDGARARSLKGTHMANAPTMTSCEVLDGKEWKRISITEALERHERNGRCVECHRPVRAHRLASNGMAAHFEHLTRNPECSYSDRRLAALAATGHTDPTPRATLRSGSAPHAVGQSRFDDRPLSLDDLGDLRRKLTALVVSFDGVSGRQGEGIASRIKRLSQDGGPIPREVAPMMMTITEMRNSAEYRQKVLSVTESDVVRKAWQAIQEWEQSLRKE